MWIGCASRDCIGDTTKHQDYFGSIWWHLVVQGIVDIMIQIGIICKYTTWEKTWKQRTVLSQFYLLFRMENQPKNSLLDTDFREETPEIKQTKEQWMKYKFVTYVAHNRIENNSNGKKNLLYRTILLGNWMLQIKIINFDW